ncbi:MAG: hypothetical protein HGB10_11680 [Coriobacteriia bacterium]|nr:hypothetical protein [Coriobacteriia bacterium]
MRNVFARLSPRTRSVLTQILVVTGVAIVSVIMGYSLVEARSLSLLLLAAVLLPLLMVKPYWSAMLLVVSAFSLQYATSLGLLPGTTSLVQDMLALVLALAIGLRLISGRRTVSLAGGTWFLAWVFILALGAMANTAPLVPAVLGLRALLRFMPLLFAPAVLGWSEPENRRLAVTMIVLTLLQAPVALFQFLLRSEQSGDTVGGTIGTFSSGLLTVLVVAMTVWLVGLMIYRVVPARLVLIGVAALCVPPALNETKIFFVVAPLIWAGFILPRTRRNFGAALLAVVALAAGVALVLQAYSLAYGNKIERSNTVEWLIESQQQSDKGVLGRIPSIAFAYEQNTDSPTNALFGYGIGSVTRNEQVGVVGELVARFGTLVRNVSFLVRSMLEMGLLGMIAFGGMLVALFTTARRVEKTDEDGFWKAAALGAQAMIVTYTVMSLYNSTLLADAIACTLWCTCGIVAARHASYAEQDDLEYESPIQLLEREDAEGIFT